MHKRLGIVLLIAVLGAAVLLYKVFLQKQVSDDELQGKLVFAQSFDHGADVDYIEIVTGEETTALRQEKSFWRVVNKGGYYADFGLMQRFLDSVNKSIYTLKLPYSLQTAEKNYLLNPEQQNKNTGVLIKIYAKEKLLDEVIVGVQDQDKRYFFAKPADKEEIWLIDGNFDLPLRSSGWLLNPVLSIEPSVVEMISSAGKKIERESEYSIFYDENMNLVDTKLLLGVMNNLQATDVLPESRFSGEKKFSEQKVIKLTTFYGLEFICTLYYNKEGAVWLNIKLSTTSLPMAAVNDYIRDNRFLYDGWYFEMLSQQRHVLRDFRLR